MKIRVPQNLGLFPYDGNLIGGLMIGVGMALTGACPGTVLVQAGSSSINSGAYPLLGGIVGGLIFVIASPYLHRLRRRLEHQPPEPASAARTVLIASPTAGGPTIHATLNLKPSTILVAWEAFCLLILYAASAVDPSKDKPQLAGLISPIAGGLAIGAAQAAVVLLTRHSVGCSKVYENVGRYLQCAVSLGKSQQPAVQHLLQPSVPFALGIVSTSALLAKLYPPISFSPVDGPVAPMTALLGGATMAFGASVAGGCTSGHGISGLVTFSFASFIAVAAMFGAGIATSFLV